LGGITSGSAAAIVHIAVIGTSHKKPPLIGLMYTLVYAWSQLKVNQKIKRTCSPINIIFHILNYGGVPPPFRSPGAFK